MGQGTQISTHPFLVVMQPNHVANPIMKICTIILAFCAIEGSSFHMVCK